MTNSAALWKSKNETISADLNVTQLVNVLVTTTMKIIQTGIQLRIA